MSVVLPCLADRMTAAATTTQIWQAGAALLLAVAAAILTQLAAHRLLPAMLRQDRTAWGQPLPPWSAPPAPRCSHPSWQPHGGAAALPRAWRRQANALARIEPVSRNLSEALVGMCARGHACLVDVVAVACPAMFAGCPQLPVEPLLRGSTGAVVAIVRSDIEEVTLLALLVTAVYGVEADRRARHSQPAV